MRRLYHAIAVLSFVLLTVAASQVQTHAKLAYGRTFQYPLASNLLALALYALAGFLLAGAIWWPRPAWPPDWVILAWYALPGLLWASLLPLQITLGSALPPILYGGWTNWLLQASGGGLGGLLFGFGVGQALARR